MRALSLVAALALVQAQSPPNVTGTWEWQGSAGWQRIEITLKADGAKVTGLIRMGPGAREPATPAGFWQYFFDPVDFKISNGKIEGNEIAFEQSVLRPAGLPEGRGSFQAPARQTLVSRFTYRGVVQGDQISMTREVVPDKKDPWSLGNHRIQFILHRVK